MWIVVYQSTAQGDPKRDATFSLLGSIFKKMSKSLHVISRNLKSVKFASLFIIYLFFRYVTVSVTSL